MRRLLGALAVLVAAWLLAPGGVPLYDGVGFPDEPYRYVVPPRADLPRTDPPTEGRDMVRAADAAGGSEVLAQSREMGPQVAVSMQACALAAPPGAQQLTLLAEPTAPSDQPADGPVTGNVYRVSAGSDAGPVGLTGRCSPLTIALRAPTSRQPGPTMEYRPLGGSWRRVLTERVGTDVYQSPLAGFGDYALVSTAGPPGAAASGGRGGPSLLLVFLVAFLATAAGAVVLVRVGDRRRRAASGTVPRG